MAFFNKYPYTDDHQLNLDWVINRIQKMASAAGISYDDDLTQLGADNVQEAVEKLNELIAQVAQMSSAFNLIDNTIAVTRWQNGHVYSHLQTVNDPTLVAMCDAVRTDKFIVLKLTNGDTSKYFYEEDVTEVPGDYQHVVSLYDPFALTRLTLIINGLNDSANIFCEISPADEYTMVNKFNGRSGNVAPETGDYAAEQVNFSDPDFAATDVKNAIKEVAADIPSSVVNTFNGRNGAVAPQASDYNAQQIDYDNSVSGIAATNVQAAIDRVITMIFASGVASFNSRVGVVLPQAHDYDAQKIDYDNSNSGLAATDVQAAIDELAGGGMVTITLTLNGAKEDSITIYDSNNTLVGSCIFASGQTQGTCQIDVPVGGGSYKFVSGVAKDTTTGTNDYEKTVTLSDTLTQTVDVYPSNTLYWYGNEIGGAITSIATSWDAGFTIKAPALTKNTNNFTFTSAPDISALSCGVVYVDGKVDLDGVSSIKVNCSGTASGALYCGISQFTAPDLTLGYTRSSTQAVVTQSTPTFTGISTDDVSAVTTENYMGFAIVDNAAQTPFSTLTVNAIWAE